MTFLKNIAAAAALTFGLSGAAQAVTFDQIDPTTFTFTVSWNSTPFTEELAPLGVAYDFDLSLVNYTGTGNQQTGFYMDFGGNRLTTQTNACDAAGGNYVGGCNLITASMPAGTSLFSGLSAGVYNFGFYDSATPVSGELTFQFKKVAPVPVPAAGLLLLTALGGFGLARRRKTRS